MYRENKDLPVFSLNIDDLCNLIHDIFDYTQDANAIIHVDFEEYLNYTRFFPITKDNSSCLEEHYRYSPSDMSSLYEITSELSIKLKNDFLHMKDSIKTFSVMIFLKDTHEFIHIKNHGIKTDVVCKMKNRNETKKLIDIVKKYANKRRLNFSLLLGRIIFMTLFFIAMGTGFVLSLKINPLIGLPIILLGLGIHLFYLRYETNLIKWFNNNKQGLTLY